MNKHDKKIYIEKNGLVRLNNNSGWKMDESEFFGYLLEFSLR